MIAIVMLVATLTANLNYQGNGDLIRPDGFATISSFLFACLFIQSGGGMYSLDRFVFKNKAKPI